MPGTNAPYTQLDSTQVIRQSFDEVNDRLRVDAVVTATIGDIIINATDSDIAIKDRASGFLLHINSDGSINVDVVLTAAADSISSWTKDGTGNAITSTSNALDINIKSGTITLPTGAATSALQTTGNTSLSSIDTKTPALGQALAAASVPVVLTASQLSTLTPLSTVAVTQSTSPWVVSGTVTANIGTTNGLALDSSLSTLNTSVNTLLKPASTLAAVTSITNVVHVDDNAGSLTVDNNGTFAVQAAQSDTL